jgi:tetratricopeptide (TPR) repeat protein
MVDPASSPAPVVLHPTTAGADPSRAAPAGRIGAAKGWFGRFPRHLSALGGFLRRLPSIEDTRKFVVNLTMIAAALLALVVVANTALRSATVIEAIGVPKELEERGYTSAVVAQRLIDEIIRIGEVAATLNDQVAFSSLPFENKVPKIDVPVGGVSLTTFLAQLRELVGIVDTKISGEVTVERPLNVTEKDARSSPAVLSLRLRIQDKGTVHIGESAAQLDALLSPAALQLVERFDPYVAASYYYVHDDFDAAQRMLQRLLDRGKEEDRRPAVNLGGLIALAQGRYQEALAVFTTLHTTKPQAAAPLLNRSAVRIAMGGAEPTREAARVQFEEAFADALRAFAVAEAHGAPKTKRQRRDIALAQSAAGEALWRIRDESRFDEAIDHFKHAVAVDPKFARSYYLQAQIHLARKDYARAAALLAHAVDADPNYPDIYVVYLDWAEVLKDMGKPREAQKIYERAIAADPKKATGYAEVGKIYLDQRDWAKAADYFRKAIDADESWARFHYYLGRALAGAGKLEPSLAAFERAAKLDHFDAWVWAGWGQALAEAARQQDGTTAAALRAEAAAKLAKAGEIAPHDGAVLKDIAKGYVALDEPARALEAYDAAMAVIDGDPDNATLAEINRLRDATR